MTEPEGDKPADIYNRLDALARSQVTGIPDEALDRLMEKGRRALLRELLKITDAIQRLPESKEPGAEERAVRRRLQLDYLRAVIVEMGSAPQ